MLIKTIGRGPIFGQGEYKNYEVYSDNQKVGGQHLDSIMTTNYPMNMRHSNCAV